MRIADGETGLSATTIKRRLATVSSLFDSLCVRGLLERQVVPRSLGSRHPRHRGTALIRARKRLPRVLSPDEVVALTGALAHRPRWGHRGTDAPWGAAAPLRGPGAAVRGCARRRPAAVRHARTFKGLAYPGS